MPPKFWSKTPTREILPRIEDWIRSIWEAVVKLAHWFAAKMEAAAKIGAPWKDRTSNARQGLLGKAVEEATRVVIWLVHQEWYGLFLELGTSHSRPYPIILPVLEAHHAPLMNELRRILKGGR